MVVIGFWELEPTKVTYLSSMNVWLHCCWFFICCKGVICLENGDNIRKVAEACSSEEFFPLYYLQFSWVEWKLSIWSCTSTAVQGVIKNGADFLKKPSLLRIFLSPSIVTRQLLEVEFRRCWHKPILLPSLLALAAVRVCCIPGTQLLFLGTVKILETMNGNLCMGMLFMGNIVVPRVKLLLF